MTPKFPRPWTIEVSGPDEFIVTDANGKKLFHIVADDGDEDDNIPPSALGRNAADDDLLIDELTKNGDWT